MQISYYKNKKWKYQLADVVQVGVAIFPGCDIFLDFVSLTADGELTILPGYAWDGASFVCIDTKTVLAGSLVHDALYQLMRNGLDLKWRKAADQELRRICLDDGMWKWRANWIYRAVRRAAGPYANPKRKLKLLTAPLILLMAGMLLAGCGHTQATRTEENGTVTLTLNRLDSEAMIDGDYIKTKNASFFDRLLKIPQLFTVQIGPGASPAP